MKKSFTILYVLFFLTIAATAQDTNQQNHDSASIQKIINAFKSKDKSTIADLIQYPIRREYPLKGIKNKTEFIRRFNEVFDEGFINSVAKSVLSSWSNVGWRGIMFKSGDIWIADGKIIDINYQSPVEQGLLQAAIQADKHTLPQSLRDFKRPLYLIYMKKYKIRLDEKADGAIRYAAWSLKLKKADPDIVLENGVNAFGGTGGNETFTFRNGVYTYIVAINNMRSDEQAEASLEVKNGQTKVLNDQGTIKIN